MQRSKAAVSVEVKQVIGALCRLLAATGLDAVPAPETFRRAKFGAGPEENQFWQLLASILQTAGTVSSEASAQWRGDHRKLVAAGLWQTGYHADWIYWMDGGEGEEGRSFSSRDLLLGLGWLLATGTLEKLLAQRVQQLDQTLLTSVPVNPQPPTELLLEPTSLRRLQWLIGCLRLQGQTLLSMLQEKTKVLHAVFSASLPSAASSSSVQSSAVLNQDCVCIWQLCDLLEAYMNWKQVENVFWTWMDSVVDCHLRDPVIKRPTRAPSGSPRVCHHRKRGLEKMEDMLLRLPTSQEEQRRGRGDVKDRGGVERLQERLGALPLPPPLSPLPSLPLLTQSYRARLQTEKSDISRADTPDHLPATEAAELLLQAETVLLERRDRQRLVNRMQLQELTSRLHGLVLIPP